MTGDADPQSDSSDAASTTRHDPRLSPGRRLYGAERLPVTGRGHGSQEGLLTVQELRRLHHGHLLSRPVRNSLYALLDARIDRFLDEEWPVIRESYPEYAVRIRETVCDDSS